MNRAAGENPRRSPAKVATFEGRADAGTGPAPLTPSHFRWFVAGLLATCYVLSYIDRQVISLLIDPIKESFGLSDTQIGLMQGLSFSLFYVVASLPLAWLADRGYRAAVVGSCVAGWSAMTSLCGLAQNYWQLFLVRIGVAIGEAGLPPAALTTLADLFDPRRIALPTAIFMLAPFIGGGLALIGGGALYAAAGTWTLPPLPGIGELERWQLVFLVVGAPGVLLAIPVYLVLRRCGRRGIARGERSGDALRFLLRHWRFSLAYIVTVSLNVTLLAAYVTWLPAAVMRSKGIDQSEVGALFGPIYLVAGAIGTLGAGLIVTYVGRTDPVRQALAFMRACALVMLPAAVVGPLVPSLWTEMALVGLTVFLISGVNSLSSLPFQYVAPLHLRAQSIAILGLVSASIGTGGGPILAGALSDRLSFAEHPLSLALSLIAGTVLPVMMVLLTVAMRHHVAHRLDLAEGTLMRSFADADRREC